MTKATLFLSALLGLLAGCVRISDVQADAALRSQALQAFEAGNYSAAKQLIARADAYPVPQAELWRRTLDLRIALAEGTQQGELRRLLRVWAKSDSRWKTEDLVNAELTLAATLRPAYALDWLYDLEPEKWPADQRTRYNLLLTRLQDGQPMLHDDTVARWRLAIRGLYDGGNIAAAAQEAERCAYQMQNPTAALIAAKLYNELGDEGAKVTALNYAASLSPDAQTEQEISLIRTAPLHTRSAF